MCPTLQNVHHCHSSALALCTKHNNSVHRLREYSLNPQPQSRPIVCVDVSLVLSLSPSRMTRSASGFSGWYKKGRLHWTTGATTRRQTHGFTSWQQSIGRRYRRTQMLRYRGHFLAHVQPNTPARYRLVSECFTVYVCMPTPRPLTACK